VTNLRINTREFGCAASQNDESLCLSVSQSTNGGKMGKVRLVEGESVISAKLLTRFVISQPVYASDAGT
jgi:hypothetical protein